MQSGFLHRSHSPPFLPNFLRNHPWPSTSFLRFPSLSSRISAMYGPYPRGAPDSGADRVHGSDSGRKRDGERRLEAKQRRSRLWWSDDEPEELAPGFWEEFLDNMWFLKVLESYGWTLPFIMISWLAASGPKAFLMAFSIPFGLSVLTYVFNKVSALIQSNTDYKPATRATNTENVMVEEEEREIQWKSRQRTPDQSDSVASGEKESLTSNGAPSFGGWEDLIDERELRKRPAQRSRRARDRTSVPLQEKMRELKTRVEGERDLPLLLKLLVAVFPFLSSWTEFL